MVELLCFDKASKDRNVYAEDREMELATRHFVRPQALNHHETVYAGILAEWFTEAAMIGVTKVLKRNDCVVLASLKEMRVTRPMTAGNILTFEYEIGHVGMTSIEIQLMVRDMLSGQQYAEGSVVFVTVDEKGKKTPHGLRLERIDEG